MELADVRVEIDQMSEDIIGGLKRRSRYPLSEGIFSKQAYDGKTWFNAMLFGEQDLYSKFGKNDFEDQPLLLFTREEVSPSKIKRNPPKLGVVNVGIDVGNKVIDLYQQANRKICPPGEDENNYGKIAKLDASNTMDLYERICGIGQVVAALKIRDYPEIVYLDKDTIISKLRNPKREQEVIDEAAQIAKRYLLPHPEIMPWFFRGIIDITLIDVELNYVLGVRRIRDNEPRVPPGFGQVARKYERKGIGFGQA